MSKTLGNIADANINYWAEAIDNLQERYPEAKVFIPSHGRPATLTILNHTAYLATIRQSALGSETSN